MKLNVESAREYIARRGIRTYSEAAGIFGISIPVLKALELGARIGNDTVKDLYNRLGEIAVKQIIDFEGESLDVFKNKYVTVSKKLG